MTDATADQTIAAHWEAARTSGAILIPDQIRLLTEQRDAATSRLQALQGEHQLTLAELRDARLALDQQGAGEPDPSTWAERRAASLALCRFTADEPAPPWIAVPTSTGHVMPTQALRHAKQAIGLLW